MSTVLSIDRFKENLKANLKPGQEVEIPDDIAMAVAERLIGTELRIGNIPMMKISGVKQLGAFVIFSYEMHDDRPGGR